jgi:hypothetical protein
MECPMVDNLSTHEPTPQRGHGPAVIDLVAIDLEDRKQYGMCKYGMLLRPFNGRNALIDAYQEALDLVVYLRQLIYEQEVIGRIMEGKEDGNQSVPGV